MIKLHINKLKCDDIIMFLLFFPFFFPRGFGEYFSLYKLFYTLYIYASCFAILIRLMYKISFRTIKIRKYMYLMIIYHLYLIIDTVILQHGIHEGFQKMIVVPILCIACEMYLGEKPVKFINSICNILLFVFSLNLFIFNPFFFSRYFSSHDKLIFLGHVQMASQIGLLGIIVSFIALECFDCKYTTKYKLLIILSIATMAMSLTVLSLICLFVVFGGIILSKLKLDHLLKWKQTTYFLILAFINLLTMLFLARHEWNFISLGIRTTLHGRLVIWKQITKLLSDHWIFGYGTYGYKIKVYWSAWTNAEGMIYAHNEYYQILLDGGIILLGLFILMIYCYLRFSYSVKNNKKLFRISNIVLISFLLIMLIDCPTEYYFFFVVLSFFPWLGKFADKRVIEINE